MTNLEIIKKACIAANPEIVMGLGTHEDRISGDTIPGRRIGIADVLLAMKDYQKEGHLFFSGAYVYHGIPTENHLIWNLRDDDLEHQSEETKSFLAGLLKETS